MFYLLTYLCVCVGVYTVCLWQTEDSLQEFVRTHVLRFLGLVACTFILSHLTEPD